MPPVTEALGILEVTGFTPALVALDRMDKTAGIRVVQAELNDWLGRPRLPPACKPPRRWGASPSPPSSTGLIPKRGRESRASKNSTP